MHAEEYIEMMRTIESLKNTTRHSWTSCGRHESVAEHCWRLACMALLCEDEYPSTDINKVIRMCLIHDFGEAITGDIPAFEKTDLDESDEAAAVQQILSLLPSPLHENLSALFTEIKENKTQEAKLFTALDKTEALLSHNEAPLDTWIEKEYTENLIYGEKETAFSVWTQQLREKIREQSVHKIQTEAQLQN